MVNYADEFWSEDVANQSINDGVLNSLWKAKDTNPDGYAKAMAEGQRYGLSPQMVEAFPDELETRKRMQRAADLATVAPRFSAWVSEDLNNAKISQGDLGTLAQVERFITAIPKSFVSGYHSVTAGNAGLGEMVAGAAPFGGDVEAYFARQAAAYRRLSEDAFKEATEGMGATSTGFMQGIRSLPGSASALVAGYLTRNPKLAAAFMSAPVAGEGYSKSREVRHGKIASVVRGASDGLIEYATEVIPATKLLKGVSLNEGFLKLMARVAPSEILGEQLATIAQDFNAWMHENQDMPLSEYLRQRPGAAYQTFVATLVGTTIQTGAIHVTDVAINGAERRRNQAFMEALGEGARASKMREALPSKFAELVNRIADGGPVREVRIPAAVFVKHFSGADMNPAEVAADVDARNYQAAIETGTGDIIIPLGSYAAKIAPTDHHAALMPDIRLRDGDLTANEYAAWEREREQSEKDIEAAAGSLGEGLTQSARQLQEGLYGHLTSAGMGAEAADAMAGVISGAWARAAEREGVTPAEMAARYGMPVQELEEAARDPSPEDSAESIMRAIDPAIAQRGRRSADEGASLIEAANRGDLFEGMANPPKSEEVSDIVNRFREFAAGGMQSKDWYEESASYVKELFGGDTVSAEKFIKFLAITSAHKWVTANTTIAQNAWEQYARGEKIDTGDREISKTLNDLAYHGIEWEGLKTNTFYVNLIEAMRGHDSGYATMDMHMAKLAYGKESLTERQYEIIERVTRGLAAEYGIYPRQAQAAIWVTQKKAAMHAYYAKRGWHKDKTFEERDQLAFAAASASYGSLLKERGWKPDVTKQTETTPQETATKARLITAEAIPSSATKLSGILGALRKDQSWFTRRLQGRTRDEGKHYQDPIVSVNEVASLLGIPEHLVSVEYGSGGYAGGVAPNMLISVAPASVDGFTAEERARADALSLALMYVYTQDAVPWFRADANMVPGTEVDGEHVSYGLKFRYESKITEAKENELAAALAPLGKMAGFTKLDDNTVAVINFYNDLGTDKEFEAKAEQFAKDTNGQIKGHFGATSGYPDHNWAKDPEGEAILKRIPQAPAGRPDIHEGLRVLREKAFRFYQQENLDMPPRADAREQSAWLLGHAKRRGYKTIDEMAVKDEETFLVLAKKWREGHPLPDQAQAARDARDIVNPIPLHATDGEKLAALLRLSEENDPLIRVILDTIQAEMPGVKVDMSHKDPAKILEKAHRPSILAESPWHGVEHIRDALRFKVVVDSPAQFERVGQIIAGVAIAEKIDTTKLLNPKAWGWRFVGGDLRMPNGQLVEFYVPVAEMDDKAVKGPNHDLFEKWRVVDTAKLSFSEKEAMRRDIDESRRRYDLAWRRNLHKNQLTDAAALAAALNFSASFESSISSNTSISSTADGAALGTQTSPSNIPLKSSESSIQTLDRSSLAQTGNMAISGNAGKAPASGLYYSDTVYAIQPGASLYGGMVDGSVPFMYERAGWLQPLEDGPKKDAVRAALQDLIDAGVPGEMVDHVAFWGTYFQGPLAKCYPGGQAVGVHAQILDKGGSELRAYIAHELAHLMDMKQNNPASSLSANSVRTRQGGDIYEEAKLVWESRDNPATDTGVATVGKYLSYPFKQFPAGSPSMSSELFAQLTALYFNNRQLLANTLPTSFEALEVIYGQRQDTKVRAIRQRIYATLRADAQLLGTGPAVESAGLRGRSGGSAVEGPAPGTGPGDGRSGDLLAAEGPRPLEVDLDNAKLADFLRETGRAWVGMLADFASRPGASKQAQADLKAMLDAIGAESIDGVGQDQLNRLAELHAEYLINGQATNSGVRSVMRRFKAWATRFYQDASGIGAKLSPEVQGVFDRLYVGEQVAEAAAQEAPVMFLNAESAGMSEAEFALYQKAIEERVTQGREEIERRLMEDERRRTEGWWKERLKEAREQAATSVDAMPEYRAYAALSSGEMPDGTKIKLSRDDLVARFGEGILKKLPRGFGYLYSAEGGVSAEVAAELFGFQSGKEMVDGLIAMRPRAVLINERAEAAMADPYGDLLHDEAGLKEAAQQAMNGDRQADVLAIELRALNRMRKVVAPFTAYERQKARAGRAEARAMASSVPPLAAFKARAAGMVAAMQYRDIRPGEWMRASRKAGKESFTLLAAGKYPEAYEAKQRELLSHYIYQESIKAKAEMGSLLKLVDRLQDYDYRGKIGKVGGGYLDQIDDLLARFEFTQVTLRTMDTRKAIHEWAAEQEAAGESVNIPESILQDAMIVNWREAQVWQLQDLQDALKNIAHLANRESKFIKGQEELEWAGVKGELLDSLRANTGSLGEIDRVNKVGISKTEGAKSLWRRFDAAHMKVEQIVEWMDGGKINGPWARYFFDLADHAQTKEYDLHAEVTVKLKALRDAMPKKWQRSITDAMDWRLPGISADTSTRYTLLSIALNTGSESNMDKLLRGRNWTQEELDTALTQMSKEDWDFVQGVWDAVDSLWPYIEENEKRMTGIAPPKVERRDIVTGHGTYRGGYFPVVYDPALSGFGDKQAEANETVQDFMSKRYSRATTSRGHTKARTKAAAPIMLNCDQVLSSHIAKVVKDLSHREAVRGLNRILTSGTIKREMIDRIGDANYRNIREWVQTLISDRADTVHQSLSLHHALMRGLRLNTAVVTMGWKMSTVMAQFAGLGPSADLVGARWLFKGLGKTISEPVKTLETVFAKSGEMRHRSKTIERDVKEQLLKLRGQRGLVSDVQRTAFYLVAMTDRAVSLPTWVGGYERAKAEGLTEEDAIRAGDRAVRLSQGAGGAKDLAAVQRDSQLMKLLTMYYTPFSVLYARMRDTGREVHGVSDLPRAVARSIGLVILPAVVSELLAARGPDDDEDKVWWAAREIIMYPFASVPILRDLARWQLEPALAEMTGGKYHGFGRYQFSPVVSAITRIGSLPSKVTDAYMGYGDWQDAGWDAFEASGYVFGLPTAQGRITGEYLWGLLGGEEDPDGAAEAMRNILYRRRDQ